MVSDNKSMNTHIPEMVDGAKEPVLTKLQSEVVEITKKVPDVAQVVDTESEARAGEFLKQIKMRLNNAESARTTLVKPLNDHVKMINAEFKKTTQPLESAEASVKQAMTTYRNSEMMKEAAARRMELEAQAKSAAREGDIETLQDIAAEHKEVSAFAPKTVNTESGQIRYRKVWKYEIEDLEKLPAFCWMPDEKKIKEHVSMGHAIPGVKAWTEDVPMTY